MGKVCYGVDLRQLPESVIRKKGLDLSYVIDAYRDLNMGDKFFTNFFELLIGKRDVRRMIINGMTAEQIKATWQDDVRKFRKQRKPYLLYKE